MAPNLKLSWGWMVTLNSCFLIGLIPAGSLRLWRALPPLVPLALLCFPAASFLQQCPGSFLSQVPALYSVMAALFLMPSLPEAAVCGTQRTGQSYGLRVHGPHMALSALCHNLRFSLSVKTVSTEHWRVNRKTLQNIVTEPKVPDTLGIYGPGY
jgi:hypothetical protein